MNALAYLGSEKFQGFKPGFSRTQTLLAALGNPERALRFVHVAGTNGKGSVSACIASILAKAGYRTGLYTSPYVICWNERVQINGEYISDEALEAAISVLRPIVDGMEDAPTQFELETALALWYFRQQNCDFVVLEVGMGGEWDSTNVIPAPEIAVLCSIGLDHCDVLGNTVAEIASVKAGIIKPGCSVVSYGACPEADAVIAERCKALGCALSLPDFSALSVTSVALEGCSFRYGGLSDLFVPLAGSYQPKNAALAVTAVYSLRKRGFDISDAQIKAGLAAVKWPGRFELLHRNPVFILDGSHNPHGMTATVESLRAHFGAKKLYFVVGVMADKDVEGIARQLAPFAAGFAAVEPPNPRAMKPEALAALLTRETGVEALPFPTIAEGVNWAIDRAGTEGAAAALGSLYFSSQVRSAVSEKFRSN